MTNVETFATVQQVYEQAKFGVQVDMHTDSLVTSNIISTLSHRHSQSLEIMQSLLEILW